MIKDLITVLLTKKIGCFCDIQHFKIISRIMTDIIPEHTRFLEIPYNFWNICINDIYPYNITKKFYHRLLVNI